MMTGKVSEDNQHIYAMGDANLMEPVKVHGDFKIDAAQTF